MGANQWCDPAVVAAFMSAGAALIAAGAAVWYTVITRAILRTSADNTAVTRAIFEAAHRPYVGIQELRLNPKDAERGSLFAKLKNHGSVPAHNLKSDVRIALDDTVIAQKSIVSFRQACVGTPLTLFLAEIGRRNEGHHRQ